MKAEFSKGLDYANNDTGTMDDLLKTKDGKPLGRCTRFFNILTRLWNLYSPLSASVTRIQKRYDKAIASYFIFFRFLFLISLLFAAVYSYLIVKHIINTSDFKSVCLYSFVPCFLLYNSFTPDESVAFTSTLISFLGIGIGFCLH